MLVATAASSAKSAAATGGLFAEVDVIIDCRIEWIRGQLHFILREYVAFPGFYTHRRAARKNQAAENNN